MHATPKRHRASAQRRRDALLTAAAELSAEVGAGAVTHRAVAARAGVPLSTTSYFFDSIDHLVTEALRVSSTDHLAWLRATERAAVKGLDMSACDAIRAAVEQAVTSSRAAEGDQIEFFLAAGRQEDLRGEAAEQVDSFVGLLQDQLEAVEAPQAPEAAWAIAALGDGAMLHRFAGMQDGHRERLTGALRLLVAAAMLTDDEIADALGRYGGSASDACR
jgi:DNA-binding transcriptional regulator YbjK